MITKSYCQSRKPFKKSMEEQDIKDSVEVQLEEALEE